MIFRRRPDPTPRPKPKPNKVVSDLEKIADSIVVRTDRVIAMLDEFLISEEQPK